MGVCALEEAELLVDGEPLTAIIATDNVWCMLCMRQFRSDAELDEHMYGASHQSKIAYGMQCRRVAPKHLPQKVTKDRNRRLLTARKHLPLRGLLLRRTHALLGMYGLVHLWCRLLLPGVAPGALAWRTEAALMVPHAALSLSGLQFRVPRYIAVPSDGVNSQELSLIHI